MAFTVVKIANQVHLRVVPGVGVDGTHIILNGFLKALSAAQEFTDGFQGGCQGRTGLLLQFNKPRQHGDGRLLLVPAQIDIGQITVGIGQIRVSSDGQSVFFHRFVVALEIVIGIGATVMSLRQL
ncbi:hypothetical protein PHACT_05325 [Pseudohongiella acticola]|uniref:Uncharacterized protein n=1 Tax=Pseudohongiella acticola TaxID=1524254 RepID=A0A1E8CJH2_9GAMM|nr:hypothetical protein PHACT_05325 [Pseudohongiella acticola]